MFERRDSTKSVPLFSSKSNFICSDFKPNAIGFSSKEMFFAPSFIIISFAIVLILPRSEEGDSGMNFIMITAVPMKNDGKSRFLKICRTNL